MSRIFVSHASADNADACALREWLAEVGFEQQVFLDFALRSGIAAGEVWPRAIMDALARCEVVLCLLSPAWARSDWCRIEFEKGKDLGKSLLFAVIDANGYDSLLADIKSTYQVVHLHGSTAQRRIRSRLPNTQQDVDVSFDADALDRLRRGLEKAGLSPEGFPLTDRDRLYPGLRALDTQDAAVFFARDAEIVRTMGMLRGMRRQARARVLVVFAASGAGKSSLLRAGLWPRLRRAEREFLVLPVVRPGDAALSGEEGLIACLHACALREGAFPEQTRGEWRQRLASTGLSEPLDQLRRAAASRLATTEADDGGNTEPPMPILMVDQGEELFSEQSGAEARQLLELMTDALRRDAMIVVICLRPEACEQWQNLPGMDGVEQRFYLLPKISQAVVKDIIVGPAQRDRDTYGHDGLRIDPLLTERLLQEWSGEDALPLLALTLRRLYDAYGASGRLDLREYESAGGLAGMLDAAIEQAVDRAIEAGAMPRDPALRQALVQQTFVPALIAIHPQTQAPLRRIARFDLLPPASQGLVRALLDARLLSESVRQVDNIPRRFVEVAHEALLRQWPALLQAVDHELTLRAQFQDLVRMATAWRDSDRTDAALRHSGEALRDIETLLERHEFRALTDETTRTYLAECHALEARMKIQVRWRRKQNRAIAMIRRHAKLGAAFIYAIAVSASLGASAWHSHSKLTSLLGLSRQEAERGMHAAALRYALSAARYRSFWPSSEQQSVYAQLRMLASQPLWTLIEFRSSDLGSHAILRADGAQLAITRFPLWHVVPPRIAGYRLILVDVRTGQASDLSDFGAIGSIRYSKDGKFIAVAELEPSVRIFDTATSTFNTVFTTGLSDASDAVFNPDGTSILLISVENTVAILWKKSASGVPWLDADLLGRLIHEDIIEAGTFNTEGRMLATGSRDGVIKLWNSESGDIIRTLSGTGQVTRLSFGRDGRRLLSLSRGGQVILWNTDTGSLVGNYQGNSAIDPLFSPDGMKIVTAPKNRTLTVYGSENGEPLMTIEHQRRISAFEFSHDGGLIATASDDGKIIITDVRRRSTAKVLSRSGSIISMRFSMDAKRLLVRGLAETVLIDISTGRTLLSMPIGSKIKFSYAGDLFLANVGRSVYLFNFSPIPSDSWSTIDSADDDSLVDVLCQIVSPPIGNVGNAAATSGFYSEHTDAEISRSQILDPETERDPCHPATTWQRFRASLPSWLH